jgi:hypothetical protein
VVALCPPWDEVEYLKSNCFSKLLNCNSSLFASISIKLPSVRVRIRVMVFNTTFSNISVISLRSVLLVEEPGENHRPAASHWQTSSHNVITIGTRTLFALYNQVTNRMFHSPILNTTW